MSIIEEVVFEELHPESLICASINLDEDELEQMPQWIETWKSWGEK